MGILEGRTAIVTGAASGIGAAIADATRPRAHTCCLPIATRSASRPP